MGYNRRGGLTPISGFWSRESGSSIEGVYLKHVPGDKGGFHVVELTANSPDIVHQPEDSEDPVKVDARIGECVGVGHMSCIEAAELKRGDRIKLISNGKRQGKKGREFWDVEVYVDDGKEADKAAEDMIGQGT